MIFFLSKEVSENQKDGAFQREAEATLKELPLPKAGWM